jgi:hypothetical protein
VDAAAVTGEGLISAALLPAPAVSTGTDTDLALELVNTGRIACLTVVVEFAVRRPLLLAHGDRRIELDRLGPGERHRHRIRLRATEPGAGTVVLRTFSYQDLRGRTVDAGGTELTVVATPPPAGAPGPKPSPPQRKAKASSRPPRCDPPRCAGVSIFVSHRSADSTWFLHLVVDHLRSTLRPHPVFADTDLRVGQVWPDQIDAELRRCAALVALIGPNWSSGSQALQHEIRTALERGILLLPVLFDGAAMPTRAALPEAIGALADRHALRVDPSHLRDDLVRIEQEVRRVLHPLT